MKKFQKILLILAACMAGLGILLILWGICWSSAVVRRLTPEESVEQSFPIDVTALEDIQIDAGVAHVVFAPSDDARVVTAGFTPEDHPVIAQADGTLSVRGRDAIGGSHILNFGFFRLDWLGRVHVGTLEKRVITVYLPEGTALDDVSLAMDAGDVSGALPFTAQTLSIRCTTGNYDLSGVRARSVSFSSMTGSHSLQNLACESLTVDQTTGDLLLQNASVTGSASINSTTGGVSAQNSALNDLAFTGKTGDFFFDGTLTGSASVALSKGNAELHLDNDPSTMRADLTVDKGSIDVRNAPAERYGEDRCTVNAAQDLPDALCADIGRGSLALVFPGN